MNNQPVTTMPHGTYIFGRFTNLTHRDVVCISFAIAVHSLLFLWKGGQLFLPDSPQQALGDVLLEVKFLDEAPNYDEAAPRSAPSPTGFLDRMKSIMKGESAQKKEDLAMGQAPKIDAPKPEVFKKADVFTDKNFAAKKAFDGAAEKKPALDVAMGKTSEITVKPAQEMKSAQPNLKENAFKVAPKDAPFQISKARTGDDSLSNVNAIPMAVGRTTSANVKSLSGPSAPPALQSKAFGNEAAKPFAGSAKPAGDTGLSTGAGAMAAAAAGTAGAGSTSANPTRNNSAASGRSWSGSAANAGSNPLEDLPRNRVQDDVPSASSLASKKGNGFNITGALANRPILNKVLPPYERDARVALRFRVDWSGRVLDGIIIEMSSGSPSFDNKVLQALKDWQFSRLPASRTNEVQEGVVTFVFKGV